LTPSRDQIDAVHDGADKMYARPRHLQLQILSSRNATIGICVF